MAETWPITVPCALINLQVGAADGRLKSQTDTGPGKMRRRSSAMPYMMTGQLVLTYQQRQLLANFIATTLAGGVLPFYFPSQIGGPDILVRFGESLPGWTRFGPGRVSVDIVLEVLP
jgi:hypothetical protein